MEQLGPTQKEELVKFWENQVGNGFEKKEVSKKLKYCKKLEPIDLEKTQEMKLKLGRPREQSIKEAGGGNLNQIKRKVVRLCSTVKPKPEVMKPISTESDKEMDSENEDELYSNLCQFDTMPDSDELESELDEDKGFTAADKLVMLNQLSKELERGENMLKELKRKREVEIGPMDDVAEEEEFKAYDEEIKNMIKEHFKDDEENVDMIEQDSCAEESDGGGKLEQGMLKLIDTIDKRVKNYNLKETNFEKHFTPYEGVTGQKLHNYFQKELMKKSGRDESDGSGKHEDHHHEVDSTIDVLYPLSTNEKRKNLKKLLTNLESEPFLKMKTPDMKTNKLSKSLGFPSDEVLEGYKEIVGSEFQIMFSDLSGSEEESATEEEEMDQQVQKESTMFKDLGDTVLQQIKDSATEDDRVLGMERVLTKYKRKQEEEVRRKKEFARWFGESVIKEETKSNCLDVACWNPGWRRLSTPLKEGILKKGWEGKRRLKKGYENDPTDEYKRLLKEYEELGKMINIGDVEKRAQKSHVEDGQAETWIKIRKGILMRDYQVRFRQGMHYLVEKRHTKNIRSKEASPKQKSVSRRLVAKRDDSKLTVNLTKDRGSPGSYRKKSNKSENDKSEKLFNKQGEATSEIRNILSRLELKHFDQRGKTKRVKERTESIWSRGKFIKYFKEKCRELNLDVSDSEENSRESFRKYFLSYYDTKAKLVEDKMQQDELNKYPFGKLKLDNGGVAVDLNLEEAISTEKQGTQFQEDTFPREALVEEILQFWNYEARTDSSVSDEETRLPNGESFNDIFGNIEVPIKGNLSRQNIGKKETEDKLNSVEISEEDTSSEISLSTSISDETSSEDDDQSEPFETDFHSINLTEMEKFCQDGIQDVEGKNVFPLDSSSSEEQIGENKGDKEKPGSSSLKKRKKRRNDVPAIEDDIESPDSSGSEAFNFQDLRNKTLVKFDSDKLKKHDIISSKANEIKSGEHAVDTETSASSEESGAEDNGPKDMIKSDTSDDYKIDIPCPGGEESEEKSDSSPVDEDSEFDFIEDDNEDGGGVEEGESDFDGSWSTTSKDSEDGFIVEEEEVDIRLEDESEVKEGDKAEFKPGSSAEPKLDKIEEVEEMQ